MSLKKGLTASLLALFVAIAWPFTYDRFGEGAQLTRELVRTSKLLRPECGEASRFFIVPWGLGLDESDSAGTLEIAYWFRRSDEWARVDARYRHEGRGWVPQQLVVVTKGKHYMLAP